jgi:hypothetical protein
MPARPPSRSRLVGIIGPLVGLFAVTCLSGTSPEDAQLFAARRQKIAGMTQSEVEQLKRNYEEFRKLSPERRQQLQELDNEVEQDTKNGGHLLKLLAGYNLWLSKLSPFEQERVVGTTDPVERAQIVKTIRDEQQKREARLALEPPRGKALTLSSTDFDAMVKAVEEHFLTADARDKLPQQLAGRDRHLRVLKAARAQIHASGEVPAATQTFISTLLDALPNAVAKTKIQSHTGKAQGPRRFLGQTMARALAVEWRPEIEAAYPQPATIDALIASRVAATDAARRDNQKNQLNTPDGRRMVGVQDAITTGEQFDELRPVFYWLWTGFPNGARALRGQ